MNSGLTSPAHIGKNGVNFIQFLRNLEDQINDTRKELNFCKKEVQILKTEENTITEMSESKCRDVNKNLTKEIHYLEELINKANNKQCAENNDYWNQCGQIK